MTISAQFGLIAQDEFFDKRIASKNISHYYLIRKGEFAYNKSTSMDAPWGAIKRLEHYDNGVLSTLYIMFRILDENKVNSDYIVSYYVTNLWHKGVREVAAEGARNHGLLNIAPVDFFETTLTIPSNENEQKNIGEYFRRLDRLITLHQRKLNILKSVPKFLLGIVWEQRKLGDIFEEYSEKGFSDLPALTIIQGEGTIKREDSDRSLKYDKASLLKYKLVKKGDFIVHLRSFEGGLEISKNIGVVSPAYHTFHGEGTDSTFYYWHFRSDDFIDIALKPHVYGIRDGRSINIEGMKTIKIPWTTLDEQSRIGNLIKCINRLITLHQRKLEKLKIIKKSMLEKCFPKKGEKVPKIRFSGFTDDWKQRKLGDVANSFEYGLNVAAKAYDGINKYIRITDIDDVSRKFLFNNLTSPNVNISEAINYQLKKGDILFARTGASVGKTYLYSEKDGMVFYAGFLIRAKISSSYDSNFIFQNTLTENYRRYIQITSQRSGQPGVNAQEYGEYKLMIPRLLEQKKIGNYFKYLDTLITLHQSKLEKLQKIKKSMLERMFV